MVRGAATPANSLASVCANWLARRSKILGEKPDKYFEEEEEEEERGTAK